MSENRVLIPFSMNFLDFSTFGIPTFSSKAAFPRSVIDSLDTSYNGCATSGSFSKASSNLLLAFEGNDPVS